MFDMTIEMNNAFQWAIKWGRLDSIKALLDAGADMYSEDIWKRYANYPSNDINKLIEG